MTISSHDTLVYRLAQMLVKLNQGEKLNPQALADEFGVNLRTIQRDLNVRFAYLPLEKSDGHYYLDRAFLGKLSTKDVDRFAGLAGVRGLFPSLSDDFLRDIFDARIQAALMVKGHNYESLSGMEAIFRSLELAIVGRRYVAFIYRKEDISKSYASVAPFKLVNHKGIWYLVALDGERLKTFSFTKIEQLRVLDTCFPADPSIDKRLAEDDGIWLNGDQQEIVIKIGKEVAKYFKRRKLIANQVIEKELEDGSLIVSARVGHINQVVPIVRYWIPHIRITSPESLQVEMENEMMEYLRHIPA